MSTKSYYAGHQDQRFGHVTFSQHGEDLMLANMFNLMGIDRPSYIDLGAHHPTTISNTKLLYDRGSRGVNVEANPTLFGAFTQDRPEDVNICRAVVPKSWAMTSDIHPMYVFDKTSGRNTMLHLEAVGFSASSSIPIEGKMDVLCMTVDNLIDRYGAPDLFSCDVEGLDLEVLSEAAFKGKRAPKVIIVETRKHQETAMCAVMAREHNMWRFCRMGENMIFVHDEYIRYVR